MKDNGIVRGSIDQAKPLIVGVTTVYVHTDIHEVEVEDIDGETHAEYEYHEYTYDKDEYIYKVADKQQADIDYIAMETGIELEQED